MVPVDSLNSSEVVFGPVVPSVSLRLRSISVRSRLQMGAAELSDRCLGHLHAVAGQRGRDVFVGGVFRPKGKNCILKRVQDDVLNRVVFIIASKTVEVSCDLCF